MCDTEHCRHRKLLLQLIGSLTLCDHMGDVSNDVVDVLDRMGIDWGDCWEDVPKLLHGMGITTLVGTPLWSPEED